MRLGLVTVAAGAALALAGSASADVIVTMPFTLNTTAGGTVSATSTETLDLSPEYTYSIQITSIRLNASLFGTPVALDPVTFGDVAPSEMTDAGSMTSLPAMLFTHQFDSATNPTYPNGFNFDVSYETLADGSLRTTLHVNSLSAYTNQLLIPSSVTVTGIAVAEVVPVPAPGVAAAAFGLGGLALRRRRM